MRRGVSSQLREDCFLNNLFSSYVYVYFYYQSAHHFGCCFWKVSEEELTSLFRIICSILLPRPFTSHGVKRIDDDSAPDVFERIFGFILFIQSSGISSIVLTLWCKSKSRSLSENETSLFFVYRCEEWKRIEWELNSVFFFLHVLYFMGGIALLSCL